MWTMVRSNLSKIISSPDLAGCLGKQTNSAQKKIGCEFPDSENGSDIKCLAQIRDTAGERALMVGARPTNAPAEEKKSQL